MTVHSRIGMRHLLSIVKLGDFRKREKYVPWTYSRTLSTRFLPIHKSFALSGSSSMVGDSPIFVVHLAYISEVGPNSINFTYAMCPATNLNSAWVQTARQVLRLSVVKNDVVSRPRM